MYGFADLAQGNILGSAIDGLFGANPAQVNEEQIAALEAYLAQLPADTAATATAAGAEVIATVADGVEQGAGAVRQAGNAIGSEAAQGVRDGIAQSAGKVAGAWDAVASALAKGPKIMSRAARLQGLRQGRRPRHADAASLHRRQRPARASYWESELAKVSAAQAEFRGTTTKTMGEVKADLAAAGVTKVGPFGKMAKDAKRDAGKLKAGVTSEMDATARRTKRVRRAHRQGRARCPRRQGRRDPHRGGPGGRRPSRPRSPRSTAYAWGQHAGSTFASGLASQAAAASAAAQELAAATHAAIGFSQPPRTGPLATIRSWGPHLVATWLDGHRAPRRRRRADRVPARRCHDPATPGTRLGGCRRGTLAAPVAGSGWRPAVARSTSTSGRSSPTSGASTSSTGGSTSAVACGAAAIPAPTTRPDGTADLSLSRCLALHERQPRLRLLADARLGRHQHRAPRHGLGLHLPGRRRRTRP